MRPPPPISELPRYPVTGATGLLAAVVSVGWWAGRFDVEPLAERAMLRHGEPWRLLTCALPHVNPLHLLFNLYWLWVFGTLVERTFGPFRTLGLFVLLAATSAGAEYALLDGGVGLSGVGYGLFGLLWVLSRRDPRRFGGAVDARTAGLFVVWFVVCILTTVSGAMAVANIAHGVGAITGAVIGFAITSPGLRRALASIGAAALFAAGVLGAAVARPYVNLSPRAGAEEAYLGYDALNANRDDVALRCLQEAVRMKPDDGRSWFNLGIAYERLSRPDDAHAAFARARALDPENAKYKADAGGDTEPEDRPAPASRPS